MLNHRVGKIVVGAGMVFLVLFLSFASSSFVHLRSMLVGDIVLASSTYGNVKVVNASCKNINNTNIISVLLQFPTAGYKVKGNYSLNNETLIVNLAIEKPKGPVAQVITYYEYSIKMTSTPSQIVVYINGSKVYEGSCILKTTDNSPTKSSYYTNNTNNLNIRKTNNSFKIIISGVSLTLLAVGGLLLLFSRR